MPEKCTGHSTRTGRPCKAWPVRGATVCVAHGGAAPQVRAAARRRVTARKAAAAVGKLGYQPVDDPLSTLAQVGGELVAIKDYLRGQVERLTQIRTTGADGSEQLRAELAAYQQSLRDTVSALVSMAKLDIDDRLARITEARAAVFVAVLLAALAEVPHPEQARFLVAVDAEFGRAIG